MPTARRRPALAALALVLLLSCSAPAATGPAASSGTGRDVAPASAGTATGSAPRESVKAIYVAISMNGAPFWIAKEAGFFDQQGLDVDMTYVAGAATPAQALTAGEALFASGGAATVTPARLAGADLILLGAQVDSYQFQVFAQPSIQRPEQLKGTRMGITRLGAATEYAARAALKYWGMEAPRDVSFIQLGGNPEVLLGLETGAIDSGLVTDPHSRAAIQKGYRELLDLADTGAHYSASGLVTTDSIIRDREQLVRRYTRAWVDAIHYFATDKAGSIPIISKYMGGDDPTALSAAYDYHIAKHLRRIPYPSLDAVQTVLDGLAETDPKARDAQPAQFVNDRFIRELDEAGVFRQLYGSQ